MRKKRNTYLRLPLCIQKIQLPVRILFHQFPANMNIPELRRYFLQTASLDKSFLESKRILHIYLVRRTQRAKGPATKQSIQCTPSSTKYTQKDDIPNHRRGVHVLI